MTPRFILLATAAAALAACSSVPERNPALEQARVRYNAVQSEPQTGQHAAEEMRRAAAALAQADKAQADGDGKAAVDHLAYVATQRVAIAQETANSRSAQAVTAGASAERDRLQLAQRTLEADTAQRQLAVSRQEGARKSAELAQADRSARDTQAQLARSDAQVSSLEMELKDLKVRRTERGIVVTLGDMLFDTGKARLQADGARSMVQLADFMKRNPQRLASIEGYTDSVGSDSSNQDLSDRRARAVMDALVSLGVDAGRLSPQGHGEDSPVAGNDTASGRQQNRRVEVVFAAAAGDMLTK
jgi:outer membrane protein OmpA-like peptidoglycan-associated protein